MMLHVFEYDLSFLSSRVILFLGAHQSHPYEKFYAERWIIRV